MVAVEARRTIREQSVGEATTSPAFDREVNVGVVFDGVRNRTAGLHAFAPLLERLVVRVGFGRKRYVDVLDGGPVVGLLVPPMDSGSSTTSSKSRASTDASTWLSRSASTSTGMTFSDPLIVSIPG